VNEPRQSEIRSEPAKQPQPHKRRCAYTKRGTHYFVVEDGSSYPFCSDKCAKRDERDGPN